MRARMEFGSAAREIMERCCLTLQPARWDVHHVIMQLSISFSKLLRHCIEGEIMHV